MNIQLSINYAIEILQYLHDHDRNPHMGRDISKATGISYQRFVLIASQLKKHGLLDSVRGKSGGHLLGRPVDEISLLDIYMAIQEDMQINRCFNKKRHCTINDISTCHRRGSICNLQVSIFAEKSRPIWVQNDDGNESKMVPREIWGRNLRMIGESLGVDR